MFQIKVVRFKKIYLLILSVTLDGVVSSRLHRFFLNGNFFIAFSCSWFWEFFKTLY